MQLFNRLIKAAALAVALLVGTGCEDGHLVIDLGPKPGTVSTARLLAIRTVTIDNRPCSDVEVGVEIGSDDIVLKFADGNNRWELDGFPTDNARDGKWVGESVLRKPGNQKWIGSFDLVVYEKGENILSGHLVIDGTYFYIVAQ